MEKIVKAFKVVGLDLEYDSALNEGRGLYYADTANDGRVELWVENIYLRGSYYAGLFGQDYGLSSRKADWLENFSQDLPAMAAGKELNW